MKNLKNDSKILELEPLCEYLDSFTMAKLTEVSKLVNKVIKNVKMENFLDAHEVALNPFMKLKYYLKALIQSKSLENLETPDLQEARGVVKLRPNEV